MPPPHRARCCRRAALPWSGGARRRTARRRDRLPAAGSARPAGAGSRHSEGSRPSRGRSSGEAGYGSRRLRQPARRAAKPAAAMLGGARRCGRRRRRYGRTPRWRGHARRGVIASGAVRRAPRGPPRSGAGRRDDRDVGVVLGGGPDHGRPADVDLLDQLVDVIPGRSSGGRERVEVHDHELERRDARRRAAGADGRGGGGRRECRHGSAGGAS